jgi:hypothetical protein
MLGVYSKVLSKIVQDLEHRADNGSGLRRSRQGHSL